MLFLLVLSVVIDRVANRLGLLFIESEHIFLRGQLDRGVGMMRQAVLSPQIENTRVLLVDAEMRVIGDHEA